MISLFLTLLDSILSIECVVLFPLSEVVDQIKLDWVVAASCSILYSCWYNTNNSCDAGDLTKTSLLTYQPAFRQEEH